MKSNNQSPDLKDDDIRALLDARTPTGSPADLDARILAAAKAEVAASIDTKNVSSSRASRYGSWMAVAAVCILAVILVPVMQLSDEATLGYQPPAESFNDTALPSTALTSADVTDVVEDAEIASDVIRGSDITRDTFEPDQVATAPTLTAELNEEQASRNESAQKKLDTLGEQTARERDRLALAPEIKASVAAKAQARSVLPPKESALFEERERTQQEIDAMTDDEIRGTFESHPYRRDRDSWLAEIKRLESLKDTLEVVRETLLFERMHPEVQ